MKTSAKAIGLALVMLALGVGCTTSATGSNNGSATGASTGGAAGASGDGGTAASGLGCNDILTCATKCASTDTTCVDGCIAKGSPDGKTKATALDQCIRKQSCADTDCVKTKCSAELTACVKSTSGSTAGSGAPTTGSVPPEMVGMWQNMTMAYEFKADGSVTRGTHINNPGCTTTGMEYGVAVANGSSLTIHFTSGNLLVCGSSGGSPYKPGEESFTWTIETRDGIDGPYDALTLVQADCNQDTTFCSDSFDRTS